MISLLQLLKFASDQGASDLHIVVGSAPAVRINGSIVRVRTDVVTKETSRKLCYSVLSDAQKADFEEKKELDFSFEVKGVARFRANFFVQRGAISGVFRRIPVSVPKFDDLGLPQALVDVTRLPHGLVLVTGPTGSGKSTTIATLIDRINQEESGHILTLEDPIEFIHPHKNCIVNQREVGQDTLSFRDALRYVLRQDPDVCLVGELRDLETIELALITSETGHLVFGTLHTNSAVSTITRLVSVFSSDQQERIRVQIASTLQAVLAQRLVPAIGGGRLLVSEFLVMTPGIRNLVREGKLHQVESMMQIGQEKTGMVTMNQSLMNLIIRRKIDVATAFSATPNAENLEQMVRKAGL